MTYFDKVRVVICNHKNRARSLFLEFFFIVEGGRTHNKRILRVHFDVFPRSSCCNFRPLKQSLVYVFLEFLLIVEGGGILDKRIPEGLF